MAIKGIQVVSCNGYSLKRRTLLMQALDAVVAGTLQGAKQMQL